MFKSKRSLNYANVTATLALVFSMSGGALAANHYLISSTKQISPKVLKKLKGNAGAPGTNGTPGATGATGATGPQGKEGAQGKEGSPGKEGKQGEQGDPGPLLATLPSGKTLKGDYDLEGSETVIENAWGYPIPLASAPTAHFITKGATPPAACPGTLAEPAAAPGNLCVYEGEGGGPNLLSVDTSNTETDSDGNANRFGFGVTIIQSAAGTNAWSEGTWAVTAP